MDAEKTDAMVRAGRFDVLGTRAHTYCAVPLKRRGGEVFGVFAFQTYAGEPPLEPRHGMLLEELAPTLAAAVLAHRSDHSGRCRGALLNAAADIAHLFVTGPNWRSHLQQMMDLIGPAAGANRAYIFSVERSTNGRHRATQLAEWVSVGTTSQIDNPNLIDIDLAATGFSRWEETLRRGEPISGPVGVFPASERPLLQAQGIQSLHIEPVHVSGRWWGFLGFDDCLSARAWLRAERDALRLCAKIIGQAIHRDRVQQELELHHTALSAAANGIVITDNQGRILWVNDAFVCMTGYQRHELLCQTPAIISSGQHGQAFYGNIWKTIQGGKVWRGEIVNRRKDGSLYTEEMTITPVLDAAGKPTHFIAIKQDISERKALQQQLLHAQKLESIGRLAGGIAHDFNNMLQVITGFGAVLLSELDESDARRSDVLEIERAAQRATTLTRQLLSFSRRQRMVLTRLALDDVVRGAETMLRRLLPENIGIEVRLDAANVPIRGDGGHLEQVLVNLGVNARDAMPNGGHLLVKTEAVWVGSEQLPPLDGVRAGLHAVLEVRDTGCGMSQDVIDQLFEPFYTTKEPGRGTGLGLSAAYGIVRQHNGFIQVESRPGAGTRFRIFLPAEVGESTAPGELTAPAEPQEPSGARLVGKGEHILVLEDEDGVRELIVRILANNRYKVAAARTVSEARALLKVPEMPYTLLFSDVVLPDGNGLELAEEVRRSYPQMKVILTSGYAHALADSNERIARLDGFLHKPYRPPMLLQLLRRVLDEAPAV